MVDDDHVDLVDELRDWAFIIDNSDDIAVVVMLSGAVFSDAADEIERLRAEVRHKALDHLTTVGELMEAAIEVDNFREWKAVAEMFGAAFHVDEWGQYSPSDGSDVHQAVLAYERLKTKEARRG